MDKNALEVSERRGVSGKVDIAFILAKHLDRLGQTLAKLPSENIKPESNEPTGVKYEDIKQSFIDGVNYLSSLTEPLQKEDEIEIAMAKTFDNSFKVLKENIRLMDRHRLLYEREIEHEVDSQDGVVYATKRGESEAEEPTPVNDLEQAGKGK